MSCSLKSEPSFSVLFVATTGAVVFRRLSLSHFASNVLISGTLLLFHTEEAKKLFGQKLFCDIWVTRGNQGGVFHPLDPGLGPIFAKLERSRASKSLPALEVLFYS